jgi:multicomponent Na+:H+ antiporter subunit B
VNQIFLFFWLASAVLIIREQKIVRLILYLGMFSLISSLCFLLFAAPDVAMAEAVISAFSTIVFIVCFEKYYSLAELTVAPLEKTKKTKKRAEVAKRLLPVAFTASLAVLFVLFIPAGAHNAYLKDLYTARFVEDVGGENAVTAIYLGYRMYDTLFEALMLLVSIVAVIHLSWHKGGAEVRGKPSDIRDSDIAGITVRIVCPILLLFSVYLIMNGYISPGGGFQGGVMIATFFVCRYMIYDINDVRIDRVITFEKLAYVGIVLVSMYFVVIGAGARLPVSPTVYLTLMNLLVGVKVACGFLIVFYRFIVFERR